MQYEVISTGSFTAWLRKLRDRRAAKAIAQNIIKMEGGLFGNVKSVGDGVSELKVDVGAGYRVYFVVRGLTVIVLLTGGDKSSQRRDIEKAKEMAAEI